MREWSEPCKCPGPWRTASSPTRSSSRASETPLPCWVSRRRADRPGQRGQCRLSKELRQRGCGGGGLLLGEEVPGAGDSAGGDVGGVLRPDCRGVVALADETLGAPHDEQGAGDPVAGGVAGLIVIQVDAR